MPTGRIAVQDLIHAFTCDSLRCTKDKICTSTLNIILRIEKHCAVCRYNDPACKICKLMAALQRTFPGDSNSSRFDKSKPLWREQLLAQRAAIKERHRCLMRRWRGIAKSIGPLLAELRHASEVAYAPGGIGFKRCHEEFVVLANACKKHKQSAPPELPVV
mmetsp:Transcript_17916/g.29877  ORF Transcript_17916/g.29877 Transcript_17916/m.29877 type:complete len:161 (-) Transcript_17916:220-702(-)